MDALKASRREARQAAASAAVARVLQASAADGIPVTVIGSLAKGGFGNHSDVDFLVRGAMDHARRIRIERLVADCLRPTAIPYDLIFEEDLTEDRVREFV